ncbi:MAG TPA: ABC transporter permease subunit [Gammaproteobacteria bacterium]|jgi:NitT/TauT family transport system permease protein|nr:ABC transporter permease subunit [Gammaproteobacteria bacterium]
MNFIRETFKSAYQARAYPNYWDLIALLFVLSAIGLFAWAGKQMATPYQLGQVIPISLNPAVLPFYAMRTVVRMLIALVFSFLFTFTFATWAAKDRRAERLIIPIIDVLQSVPILGYLSVTVAGFISLFPGSLLGPECAAIFVIFTSQAWNMALGFYQTVRSVPADINEAAHMFRLSAWQRFWRIDVPFSMPSLLWNTMASMSAGWFFVVASEAITVSNQQILLPGIGSYIAVAVRAADVRAILYAILTMFIVILIYDQLLFRPLVSWAEKFKAEQISTERVAESWVVDLFRHTRWVRLLGRKIIHLFDLFVNIKFFHRRNLRMSVPATEEKVRRWFGVLWMSLAAVLFALLLFFLSRYIRENYSMGMVVEVFALGLITALRVFIMIVLCSLIWVPVGVWVGLRPRAAQLIQPIAQFLAAFPTNLLYPLVVPFILYFHLNPNLWLTPLMILGAQWYILFNVIAGVSALPKDLIQAVDNLGVTGWLRWRKLFLPCIFPYYVTGAMTAAGGAWNASILAEVVSWGQVVLTAKGLGSYITLYTTEGNFPCIALGIGMMCMLVLLFNRVVWRPLYLYAVNRFLLE